MLTRIENAYLAILRIVVLIAATLALLVAIGALLTSLPALGRRLGMTSSPAPAGGTLGEYIAAKKATAPIGDQPKSAAAPAENARSINPDIRSAAGVIQTYSGGVGSMTIPKWEQEIEQSGSTVPVQLHTEYFSDLSALTNQLKASKGKKLDVAEIRELIAWNRAKFLDDAAAKATERQVAAAKADFRLYVAGASFVLFILVVFTFLFVKVERSLRVVRTIREDAIHA